MGARLNWIAVERGERSSLLARLGLSEAGVVSHALDEPLACAEFAGGWLVVVSNDMGLDLDRALTAASADGLALGCELDEHVMFSRLRAFSGGHLTWSVTHDPDVDLNGAAVEGSPPAPFEEIRRALATERAGDDSDDVDYFFDLPPRLGLRLCGYSHEQAQPLVWTLLEPARRRVAAAGPPRLPAAFRAELLPHLEASGWSLATRDPQYAGAAWDVTRVIDGRRQFLVFAWRETGPDLNFEVNFRVQEGEGLAGALVVAGNVRVDRSLGSSGGSLWRRIAHRFRGSQDEASAASDSPPDPLADLISRAKVDIAAAETFLATGEETFRIDIQYGSAAALIRSRDSV